MRNWSGARMFRLGYNTNGFSSHSLVSAVDIIGALGYESIALSVDHHALNPYEKDGQFHHRLEEIRDLLRHLRLSSVVETGARFLLNPWVKHEPTLVSPDQALRDQRLDFLEKCIGIAAALGSDAVSIWSGVKSSGVSRDEAWEFLVDGCQKICETASKSGVAVAFEPEPGMLVENMEQYDRLRRAVNHQAFKLTLDLGHAFITEKSVPETILAFKDDIVNIHLEDMKKDRHDHLFFGKGDMDFHLIFSALEKIEYKGPVNIELSRHSPDAVSFCKKALDFVQKLRA